MGMMVHSVDFRSFPGILLMVASRRQFLTVTAASSVLSRTALGADAKNDSASASDEALPPPRYHLAMNLEIMFPRAMPYEERLEQVAACGAKHYGFWGYSNKNLDRLLEVQQKY